MALVINKGVLDRLEGLRAWAEDPQHVNRIANVLSGDTLPPGDIAEHVIEIQEGYRAVYSVDEDQQGMQWKHLSVSSNSCPKEGLPTEAIVAIAKLLGIRQALVVYQGVPHKDLVGHVVVPFVVN